MRPGGGALRWSRHSPRRGRGAATARLLRSTGPERFRPSSHRTSTICIRYRGLQPITSWSCIGCGKPYDLAWVKRRFDEVGGAPDCSVCDEPVKTATISFGQAMPEDAMRRAAELAQGCDLFIAIGSSLVVWPAAGFPLMAKKSGAKLVIINNEATDQDDIADLVIRHDIGETLGPFVGN